MDWLSKPGNWTLIALPVVEWHDLELRRTTLKIANFAELCVTVGKRHCDSGLANDIVTVVWASTRQAGKGFSGDETRGSFFYRHWRHTWPWQFKMAAETRSAYGVIRSTLQTHTRETPTLMSMFSGTTNWKKNVRSTPADVDRHRKCKADAWKPEVLLLAVNSSVWSWRIKPEVLVMTYVSAKCEIIT